MSILRNAEGIKKKASKAPRPSELFPKLEGPNKPPVLTSKSQPEIKIDPVDLAPLPNMRVKGRKPNYTTELNRRSPYHKE